MDQPARMPRETTINGAARLVGRDRSTIWRWVKKYELDTAVQEGFTIVQVKDILRAKTAEEQARADNIRNLATRRKQA